MSIELLLPVGTKEMALAAIHNGADAIFLGVPGFNARGRSHDFAIEDLKEIMTLCHTYGVKVNLAFNVVIFQEELPSVIELLEQIIPLKPDAFIVQDIGLIRLIRQMASEQRIHASTQMTITNYEAIELLEDLEIKRFVLGRENSLPEIKAIRSQTQRELETFVHGALCVSYSGQCFTSESIGGRSANRGQCAQSCRLGYELHVDGEKKEMGDKKYLVSPQDLCGLEEVPELMASGVNCFKVEGRLKTPEYVATSARAYRQALDHAERGQQLSSETLAIAKKDMAVSYSRGFFSGWLHGVEHQKLVSADFSAHRGHEIGRVIDVFKNTMTIAVSDSQAYEKLLPGDGLFWAKGKVEQGGFIYGLDRLPKSRLRIEFARDMILFKDLDGALVYQNHDKELKKSLAQSTEDKNKKKRLPIKVKIQLGLGKPLLAQITDGEFAVEGATQSPAALAQNRGVSDDNLTEEFSSLTGSLFRLESTEIQRSSPEDLFLPHREIKSLRQALIAELTEKRQAPRCGLEPLPFSKALQWMYAQQRAKAPVTVPRLNVLLREKAQVLDLVQALRDGTIPGAAIDTVTLDFEFGRDYRESCEQLRSVGLKVGVATTRVLKPNEYRNLKVIADLQPDSILVRNLGALQYLTHSVKGDFELRGDFSFNVTNHLTADYLFQKGLSTLCLSYDLNQSQVAEALNATDASRLEVTLYQYMPSFHMEHCVFAAFLSQGSSFRDCGKPCEKHELRLKDQFQNWHQIKADQECRNTMFNARAQSAARYLDTWSQNGLGFVRYEALKERGEELLTKLQAHIDLLNGKMNFQDFTERVGAIESYGLSEGAIGRDREYQSRKKH